MSNGLWILAVIGLVFGAMFLFQQWLGRMARAQEGRPAPTLGPFGEAEGKLVWFHSPSCGPCRAMHDDVVALGDRVIEVDVSERPDIAQGYGIMATPTTVRVKEGVIAQVRPGRMRREELEAMLAL
jgi:thioredoxin 1